MQLAEILSSGRIADLILALMAIEGVTLAVIWRSTGRGVPLVGLCANLAAGACLILALRSALMGSGYEVTAACLAAGLVAHVVDLKSRWR